MATFPFSSSMFPRLTISAMRLPFRSGCGAGARTSQPDPPGAHELAHAVRTNELLERLDLVGAAGQLEGDRVTPDIGDACAGGLAERDEVGAPVGRDCDRDQRELTLDRLLRPQLRHTK